MILWWVHFKAELHWTVLPYEASTLSAYGSRLEHLVTLIRYAIMPLPVLRWAVLQAGH